jgi:internalin A
MRNCHLLLCLLLLITGSSLAQEQTPYDLALERIEAAEQENWGFLDLSNLDLSELPFEIGTLLNLQTLDLSDNQLSSLPPEIGNLANLHTMDLSTNRFSSVPHEIGHLSSWGSLHIAPKRYI